MVGSILGSGALASADIGWDQYVNLLSQHLPGLSRQALLFANSVMSKEVKAEMFNRMTAEFKAKQAHTDRRDTSTSQKSTQSESNGSGVNETGTVGVQKNVDTTKWEMEPVIIRDPASRQKKR